MLRVLVWKELLEHLRSLRFAVSFATIVGLFVLGAWVWNLRIAEERQGLGLSVEEYEGSIQEHAEELGSLALLPLHLWMPTADLTFASGGYSRSLPNVAVTVPVTLNDDEHLSGFERRADRNPLLFRLDPDWVFIAGMLGTLMALLLTYDGVAGEKERGCLRQLLANRVPRDQVLIAKYLAGLAMSAAPILTGAVAAVAVIQLLGKGLPGGWMARPGRRGDRRPSLCLRLPLAGSVDLEPDPQLGPGLARQPGRLGAAGGLPSAGRGARRGPPRRGSQPHAGTGGHRGRLEQRGSRVRGTDTSETAGPAALLESAAPSDRGGPPMLRSCPPWPP